MRAPGPLVVMGVSGSGKSTVGEALAARLGAAYVDADDLHPPANIARMRGGQPLTDEDRWPWLDDVGRWLADHVDPPGVTACSALRRAYRDRLRRWAPTTAFVHLDGDPALIAARQSSRPGHFMPANLLQSQFQTLEPLEPDERGVAIDVDQSIDAIVESFVSTPHSPTAEEDR